MPAAPRLHAPDRRRQLIEAALECFSRQGFKGTTTKEIAATAGVTEAIVFRHFPSKQALYQAVLDYRHESTEMLEWLAEIKAVMDGNDDAGLLRAIALKILQSYRRDPGLQRVLLFAALEGHEQGLAHYRQVTMPVFKPLFQYIERRQSEGKLRDLDPGMILSAIAGMAMHFSVMTTMFGFECDVPDDRIVDTFVSIMMTGIQPKRTQPTKGRARK